MPQLGGVRVAGPDEISPDVSQAVQVHQAVPPSSGGLVNGVEITGDDQLPRPAVLIGGELPGFLVDAGVPGARTAPDLAGSITKQAVLRPGTPIATISPGGSRRGRRPPRRLVRMQVPGPCDRSAIASSSGAAAPPAAHAPASVPGAIWAPCRASPVTATSWTAPRRTAP